MSIISVEKKLKEGRGKGSFATYKPWILCRETSSIGTTSTPFSTKSHRQIQCLSQAEAKVFFTLEFDESVVEIREQFPILPIEEGAEIAKTLGMSTKRPKRNRKRGKPHDENMEDIVWSIDFLVKHTDNSWEGIFVKTSQDEMNVVYNVKSFQLQKEYLSRRGIPLRMLFADSLNDLLCANLRTCSYCANLEDVFTDSDLLKYMVCHHLIWFDELEYERVMWAKKAIELKDVIYAYGKSVNLR